MGKSLMSCFLTHSVEIIINLAQTVQVSINNTILMTKVLLAVYDLVISGFHFLFFGVGCLPMFPNYNVRFTILQLLAYIKI